jgi:hypothetical protein
VHRFAHRDICGAKRSSLAEGTVLRDAASALEEALQKELRLHGFTTADFH